VLGACAFFTIAFGAVFGELFGSLGHELGLRPLWRERFPVGSAHLAGAILSYLGLAVGVGALQIVFGLVLGVVNARRFGDRDLAVGNLARIAGIFMLAFFVGRLAGVLPPVFTWLGLGAAAAFLALMAVQTARHPAHGLMLPIEVLGAVGNILSYAGSWPWHGLGSQPAGQHPGVWTMRCWPWSWSSGPLPEPGAGTIDPCIRVCACSTWSSSPSYCSPRKEVQTVP
jgi:hypothetical protein